MGGSVAMACVQISTFPESDLHKGYGDYTLHSVCFLSRLRFKVVLRVRQRVSFAVITHPGMNICIHHSISCHARNAAHTAI